jgi:peptidoglycan pentaglycine glycine transferase (the first glycine)
MKICTDTDAAGWDRFVLSLAAPHVLQSHAWGAFKADWGWHVHRFAWADEGTPLAAAQVLTRRIARTPFTVGYVPKGPLLAQPDDAALWAGVLADLRAWAWGTGLTLLKIDPDVPLSATDVTGVWTDAGWRRSSAPVQFPNTMVTDLTAGADAIRAAMHPKTRYNVGLARRRGVTLRHVGADGCDAFFGLYVATGARARFGVRPRDYYVDVWRRFLDASRATVILAEREGQALAGVIPIVFGRTAWYLYGASADTGREHMAPYLAQWESIRWAIARGCTRYDWWGAPTRLDPRDPLWGVFRFKQGFGATWVEQVGAWDLPVRRLRCAVYDRLDRWRRCVIAWRTVRRTGTPGP